MQTTISDRKRLIFLRGKKIFIVQPSQIVRMEAFSNYTYVYFTDRPPVLMAKVLHLYDKLLRPFGFVRTHKSHLINPLFVKELNTKGNILMRDDTIVGIARRRKREVMTQCFTLHFESSKKLVS